MDQSKLDELRGAATVLMNEIRPLKKRLSQLLAQHATVAQQIEMESRRLAKVTRVPMGVSGRQPKRRQKATFEQLFANMSAEQQASMLAQIKEMRR